MSFPERRRLERLTPERLVYVDLKPDNGGMVLNVSGEGLCFRSVAPVDKHQSFAFSLGERNEETHGMGEVVWIDESRKFGGLRFTRVSDDARSEIAEIAKAAPPPSYQDRPPTLTLVHSAERDSIVNSPAPMAVKASPLHVALLREANYLPNERRYKTWALGTLIAALAIYAAWASVQLYRYKEAVLAPAPTAVASAPHSMPSPSPQNVGDNDSAERPEASPGLSAVRHGNKIRKVAAFMPQPPRPLIQAAPVRFEYPVAGAGAPSGTVDLRLLISSTGSVQDVQVLAGKGSLVTASIRAARRWRYRPLEMDGRPVEAEAHVRLRFAGDEAVSVDFRR